MKAPTCSEADLIVMLCQLRCTVRQRTKLLHLHKRPISFESKLRVAKYGTGVLLERTSNVATLMRL